MTEAFGEARARTPRSDPVNATDNVAPLGIFSRRAWVALVAGLFGLNLLLGFLSLTIGYIDLPLGEIFRGLFGYGPETTVTIVQELRLPRLLLALLIGAGLGLSGAVLQGLLRNPLAEPGILGISSSASLGAVLAIYYGLSTSFLFALPLAAMAGAGLATIVLCVLSARNASTLTIILCGVALNGLAISLTSLAMNFSPNPYAINEMVFWLLGSVKDRSFNDVALAAPFVLFGCVLLLGAGRALDALTLGEDAAQSLGFDLQRLRTLAIAGTSLAVGGAVAVSGGVSFVGLVVPHLMRPLVGHVASRLLLPSMLAGAALVLAADIAARLLRFGVEIHLGVLTSLVGAPFFFYLIWTMRRRTL
ncbi:MAG: iron ABC transporter permease [Pseudomonadota bacterium]